MRHDGRSNLRHGGGTIKARSDGRNVAGTRCSECGITREDHGSEIRCGCFDLKPWRPYLDAFGVFLQPEAIAGYLQRAPGDVSAESRRMMRRELRVRLGSRIDVMRGHGRRNNPDLESALLMADDGVSVHTSSAPAAPERWDSHLD